MIDRAAILSRVAQRRPRRVVSDLEWYRLAAGMALFLLLFAALLVFMWLDTRKIERELFAKPAAASAQL